MNDSGFSDYYLDESAGSANSVQIDESNSVNATCLRTYLNSHSGNDGDAERSARAELLPLVDARARAARDVSGVSCAAMDGGVATDGG